MYFFQRIIIGNLVVITVIFHICSIIIIESPPIHWFNLILVTSSICTLIVESIYVFNVMWDLIATSEKDIWFEKELFLVKIRNGASLC